MNGHGLQPESYVELVKALQSSRGRGKRGPSKRGKKKSEGVGRGGAGGGGGGAGMIEPEDQEMLEPPEEVERKTEMLRVGPLFIKSTILDDILTERKQELLDHPQVVEFLRRKKM